MRILVTGAGGQLGRELTSYPCSHDVVGLTREECDIAEPGAAERALGAYRPDAVVNCAGWTAVDAAETHRAEAFKANADGPRLLARACRDAGALLCHISTDYVFDGSATRPIPEDAAPHPLSAYGESKLAGEEAVRATAPRHQVVRTAWLFGQEGPNFVLTVLRRAAAGETLRVVTDQRGAPTWTGHLAPALLRLLERGDTGIFHLTAAGESSWFEVAGAAVEAVGLGTEVVPITTAKLGLPAQRPAYSVLDNRTWRALGERALPHWRHGLAAYLRGGIGARAGDPLVDLRPGMHSDGAPAG